jgi:dTDP-3-amino-3,4,6-trideoxy-alpha-D-glucose transaminase
VVTEDATVAERVRLMRSHGERVRYHHEMAGTTARLDTLQATVLRIKLRRLDEWTAARRRAGAGLREALSLALEDSLGGGGVALPPLPAPGSDDVLHQFVVRCAGRDALRRHLAHRAIATAIHYPVPIHRTPAYAGSAPERLPAVEALCDQVLSLPIHPRLSGEEIARIADAVAAFHG